VFFKKVVSCVVSLGLALQFASLPDLFGGNENEARAVGNEGLSTVPHLNSIDISIDSDSGNQLEPIETNGGGYVVDGSGNISISDLEGFKYFVYQSNLVVNNGFEGKTIDLTGDIDLDGELVFSGTDAVIFTSDDGDIAVEVPSLGASTENIDQGGSFQIGKSVPFRGEFRGNGHKIKNFFRIGYNVTDSNGLLGLFGTVKDGAVIKDLTIEKSTLIGEHSGEFASFTAGGIVSKAEGNVTIENCTSNADIYLQAENNVMNTNIAHAGGIVGRWEDGNVTIKDCHFSGNIYTNGYAGGIVGSIETEGKVDITGCKFGCDYTETSLSNTFNGNTLSLEGAKKIASSEKAAGGIVGRINDTKSSVVRFENCHVSGCVTGKGIAGGICGEGYFNFTDNGDETLDEEPGWISNCESSSEVKTVSAAQSDFDAALGKLNKANHNYNEKQLQMSKEFADHPGHMCNARRLGCHHQHDCELFCCRHEDQLGSNYCYHTTEFNTKGMTGYDDVVSDAGEALTEKNDALRALLDAQAMSNLLPVEGVKETGNLVVVGCSVVGFVDAAAVEVIGISPGQEYTIAIAGGIFGNLDVTNAQQDVIFSHCFIKANIHNNSNTPIGDQILTGGIVGILSVSKKLGANVAVKFKNCNIRRHDLNYCYMGAGIVGGCSGVPAEGNPVDSIEFSDCTVKDEAWVAGICIELISTNVTVTNCIIETTAEGAGMFLTIHLAGNLTVENCHVLAENMSDGIECDNTHTDESEESSGLIDYISSNSLLGENNVTIKSCSVCSNAITSGLINDCKDDVGNSKLSMEIDGCSIVLNSTACVMLTGIAIEGNIEITGCYVKRVEEADEAAIGSITANSLKITGCMFDGCSVAEEVDLGNDAEGSELIIKDCAVNCRATTNSCVVSELTARSVDIDGCPVKSEPLEGGAFAGAGLLDNCNITGSILIRNCPIEIKTSDGGVGIIRGEEGAGIECEGDIIIYNCNVLDSGTGLCSVKSIKECSNLTVKNCTVKSNYTEAGLLCCIHGVTEKLLIEDCLVTANGSTTVKAGLLFDFNSSGAEIEIRKCIVDHATSMAGLLAGDSDSNGAVTVTITAKKLTIEQCIVNDSSSNKTRAGLMDNAVISDQVSVENCTVRANALWSGAICDLNDEESETACTVVRLFNVKVNGKIEAGSAASSGGLLDFVKAKTISIIKSSVTGDVKATDTCAGGLVSHVSGLCERLFIKDSEHNGKVEITGDSETATSSGGIVGSSDAETHIVNCKSSGDMSARGDYTYVGGIIGRSINALTVKDSHAHSDINSIADSAGYSGGICGCSLDADSSSISIFRCHATGNISHSNSSFYAGGIIGSAFKPFVNEDNWRRNLINQCCANCKIEANNGVESFTAGGLIGEYCSADYSPRILDSYSIGNIVSNVQSFITGGLIGRDGSIADDYSIKNSYCTKSRKYFGQRSFFSGGLIGGQAENAEPSIICSFYDKDAMKVNKTIGNSKEADYLQSSAKSTMELTGPGGEVYFYFLKRVPQIASDWDSENIWEYKPDVIFYHHDCKDCEDCEECNFCNAKLKYPALRFLKGSCDEDTCIIKENVYRKDLNLTRVLNRECNALINVKIAGHFDSEYCGMFPSDGSGLYPADAHLNAQISAFGKYSYLFRSLNLPNKNNVEKFFAYDISLEYGPHMELQPTPPHKALVTIKIPSDFNKHQEEEGCTFKIFRLNEANKIGREMNIVSRTPSTATFETDHFCNFILIVSRTQTYTVNFPMNLNLSCCHAGPRPLGTITVSNFNLHPSKKLAIILKPPFYFGNGKTVVPFQLSVNGGKTWVNPVLGNHPVELIRFIPNGQTDRHCDVLIRTCCCNNGHKVLPPNSQIHYHTAVID